MPTARKTSSGSWRVRVFSHYDYSTGKKKPVYESFTAPTKSQAERAAIDWKLSKRDRGEDITVAEAVDRYIKAKTAVLSPSTIRGYRTIQKTALDEIGPVRIRQLTNERVQLWISSVSRTRAPKTVRNIFALFLSAVTMFSPDMTFSVSLPANKKKRYNLPPDEEVRRLIDHVEGKELWIALMLAYYYGLRRGEICALTSDDLDGDMLWITKDIVLDEHKRWVVKDIPKTEDSYRCLKVAEPLLSVLKEKEGKYIECSPDTLLNRFKRAIKASKITPFNFHLMRHCYASRAAVLGVPDVYTARMGGWRPGSPVLKQVYQNATNDEMLRQMARMNSQIPV